MRNSLADRWVELKLLPDAVLDALSFGKDDYSAILSGTGQRLEPVAASGSPDSKADGLAFALSLRETRNIDTKVPLHDAIYVERFSRLLPTWTVSEARSDQEILGRWLTGGVSIPATSFRRLSSLLGWLDKHDVADLVQAAGFGAPQECDLVERSHKRQRSEATPDDAETPMVDTLTEKQPEPLPHHRHFHLAGRPVLEAFFKEHVIDIVDNVERYRTLGIDFPSAIVLHGPPGCGKSFAVERLVECLDWPSFYIDSQSVGSPYIHETSKKIGKAFDKAMDDAPSIVVIDEMESYLSDRQIDVSTGLHHVEEVAEFLRRIPEANMRHVLVIGMTNRLEMIDPAILRRGRFDHVVEVGMPLAAEVSELVDSLLAKVPIARETDTRDLVESLAGRALSDAAFVVREASRLAVRAGKNALDNESLRHALVGLSPTAPKKRPIGFVQD